MAPASSPPSPFPVIAHPYSSPIPHACAYELVCDPSHPSPSPKHAVVFIGGLGDGPHTVPYVRAIAQGLAAAEPALGYSVFEVRLSSSFAGYGFGSLGKDVEEVSALVKYLKEKLGREKVVLMGHSTGCQDCMEYTNVAKYDIAPVDGFILQGPVSDREGIAGLVDSAKLQESLATASRLIDEAGYDQIMPADMVPKMYSTPMTAYRYNSLVSVGGDDDYFSSDLPDEAVAEFWGRIRQPVLIVPSEKDEYVPAGVDFEKLVARWKSFCRPGVASEFSGLIPTANHTVDQAEGQQWLADRVVRFLRSLEGGK